MTRIVGVAVAAGLDELLSESESADHKVKTIVRELAARPDLGGLFEADVAALRKRGSGGAQGDAAERIPLEESVRLFGLQSSVSFLVAHKLADRIPCKPLARDPKTGRLLLAPAQILRFAHAAREAFGEEGRYRDSAFAAGLVFDLLCLLITADLPAESQRKLVDFVGARFARGLRIAASAVKLARGKKSLKLERHLVAAALLREAAKGAMAYIFPSYPDFLKSCEAARVPLSVRNQGEQDRFGGNYQALSKILSWAFEILSASGPALTRCDTPFMFHDEKKPDEHDLAAICFLAAHLERGQDALPPSQGGRWVAASALRPELKDLDLQLDLTELAAKGGKS